MRRHRGLGELPAELRHGDVVPGVSVMRPGAGGSGPAPRLAYPVRAHFVVFDLLSVNGDKQYLTYNAVRAYLELQNHSTSATLRFTFGAQAATGAGLELGPGGSRVWDAVVPVDSLHIWASAAGVSFTIVEGVPVA